jgi:amino-acid N-acetyltransferase
MDLDKILVVTFSGVRPAEEDAVKILIAACDLHTDDLTVEKLRHFVVARKGDALVGVVGLELFPPHALLRSLAVAGAYRGQGIAAQLVEAAERYARSAAVESLYLLTLTAEGLFRKCAYQKIRRASAPASLQDTAEFKSLCPDAAVCMQKQIA